MKLQNLLVIFITIALPVILILSAYVSNQLDTARLKAEYSSRLLDATHDAVTSFQLNSTNNKYSSVADSLLRDIEGSINTFETSLSTNLGYSGGSSSYVMSFIPALVFTLYDGYYIYSPSLNESGAFEHSLKPYVYYTKEYTDGYTDIIINYTLDNYVSVYCADKRNNTYQSRAGYLEVLAQNQNSSKGLYKNESTGQIKYNGVEIPKDEILYEDKYRFNLNSTGHVENWTVYGETKASQVAYNYYSEAYDFTKWYNELIGKLSGATPEYQEIKDKLIITLDNVPYARESSKFNDEKYDVIEKTIVNNLVQAMNAYNTYIDNEFKMPELTGEDWDKILNNICLITFMQGMPCGTTLHNDYVILPSSENEQFVNENSIYYIAFDSNIGEYDDSKSYTYHRIGCPYLQGDHIIGYNRLDFMRQVAINQDSQSGGDKLKELDSEGNEREIYYYKHFRENACYYCMVNATDANIETLKNNDSFYDQKVLAYYRAMARTKYELAKVSDYINDSNMQSFNSAMSSVSFQNR